VYTKTWEVTAGDDCSDVAVRLRVDVECFAFLVWTTLKNVRRDVFSYGMVSDTPVVVIMVGGDVGFFSLQGEVCVLGGRGQGGTRMLFRSSFNTFYVTCGVLFFSCSSVLYVFCHETTHYISCTVTLGCEHPPPKPCSSEMWWRAAGWITRSIGARVIHTGGCSTPPTHTPFSSSSHINPHNNTITS